MKHESERLLTTGIGSLPHHNIDAALAFSFQLDIPFLPQIPLRNPWEFMLAQALEGMPGLQVEPSGAVVLNYDVWIGRSKQFNEKLVEAFEKTKQGSAFEAFEPSAATSSSWQPFLFELEERKLKIAKIQIAGPITCQSSIQYNQSLSSIQRTEVQNQIVKLITARSIAMIRRLHSIGIQPIIFIDEPRLHEFSEHNEGLKIALKEVSLIVQALKKENAIVGLHCCHNTDWDSVLALGLDILSIDSALSLRNICNATKLTNFLKNGGKLALGIVPVDGPIPRPFEPKMLWDSFASSVPNEDLRRKILEAAFITPSCGLALSSVIEAELVLGYLESSSSFFRARYLEKA